MSTKQIAALFPGQGSQSVGMGKELFKNFKVYKDSLEEASDLLGLDFKKLCFEGPEEKLMLTENTQPAIVASSVSAFRLLEKDFDFKPSFVAGHSVGEYSALVSAGVLNFEEALKAVKTRGAAMQEAVPLGEGAMGALLGPSDEQAVELCKWVQSQNDLWSFEAANFNCPGQVVVSGSAEAFKWLKENLLSYEFNPKPKKVRLLPLKVSAPFHCSLMKPAEEKMAAFFKDLSFSKPQTKLIQNVNASFETEPENIKSNVVKQVSGSVMWSQSVMKMNEEGAQAFVEVGSGTTLNGLVKKIAPDAQIFNTNSLEGLKNFESYIKGL